MSRATLASKLIDLQVCDADQALLLGFEVELGVGGLPVAEDPCGDQLECRRGCQYFRAVNHDLP